MSAKLVLVVVYQVISGAAGSWMRLPADAAQAAK
jgi:hypothetical protein